MIKILSFAASCAGEQSKTACYADELAETFRAKAEALGEATHYERLTGDQLQVSFCRSCERCFKQGQCPLDRQDDMPLIKKKILESDIILFGTPVYWWEMSGLAKCVLDRLAYWTHRCELAGKTGVVFAVTDNNHGQEVADHLAQLLSFTGLAICHAGYAVKKGSPNIYLREQMEPVYAEICEKLLEARKHPEKFITSLQEKAFQNQQNLVCQARALADCIEKEPPEEVLVWERRNINKYPSLAAYIRAMACCK